MSSLAGSGTLGPSTGGNGVGVSGGGNGVTAEKGQFRPEVLASLLSTTDRIVQEIDSVEYGLTDIQVSEPITHLPILSYDPVCLFCSLLLYILELSNHYSQHDLLMHMK